MTSFSQHVMEPRSRRGLQALAIAALAAGNVMLPAGTAFADHMPGMENGTMCPHAAGEGPDALAAVGPDEPPAAERAPTQAPLAPAVEPRGSARATKPTATKPAAQAPKPATRVTQPATQVETRPATQVETQRPATSAQPTPVEAVDPVPVPVAVGATPVRTTAAAPERAEKPRPKASPRRPHIAVRTVMRGVEDPEPRALTPAAAATEAPVAAAARPATAEQPSGVSDWLIVSLIAVGGAGAWMLLRRRGSGGARAVDPLRAPIAPDNGDAVIEAELHEMISEARARELLGTGEADGATEHGGPAATR